MPDYDEQRHRDGNIREGKHRSCSRRIAAGQVVVLHSHAHGHGQKYERCECRRQGGAVDQGRKLNQWPRAGWKKKKQIKKKNRPAAVAVMDLVLSLVAADPYRHTSPSRSSA